MNGAEIKEYLYNTLDNIREVDSCSFKSNCIYCGRSKHNIPHLKITICDETNTYLFHCFRCYTGGTIKKLLKDLDAPKEIINKIKNLKFNSSNNLTISKILNLSDKKEIQFNGEIKDIFKEFLSKRLLIDKSQITNDFRKKYNILVNSKTNELAFITYYHTLITIYQVLDSKKLKYKKYKKRITKGKPDFYFFRERPSSLKFENLFIAEGVFDLITLNLHFDLKGDYIALNGKNFNYLRNFLYSIGHLYYDNVIIVADNDVSNEFYIDMVYKKLKSNYFNSLYILRAPKEYIDINDYFINTKTINGLILESI